MARKKLIGVRLDGLGCRLACFFASAAIAEESDMDFEFLWPITEPLARHGIQGDIVDIFPQAASVVRRLANPDINAYARGYSRGDVVQSVSWHMPDKMQAMKEAYKRMAPSAEIGAAMNKLARVDYAIHARLGDVLTQPLFFGSTKYFPRSGYIDVLKRLADQDSSASVFLATDDQALSKEAKGFYPALMTEADLIGGLGMSSAKSIVKLWIIASQLSNSKRLICPQASGFSVLAQIIDLYCCDVTSPAEFLGISTILEEMNQDYLLQAEQLLAGPCETRQRAMRKIRRSLASRDMPVSKHVQSDWERDVLQGTSEI